MVPFHRLGLRHKLIALIVMALAFALLLAGIWLSYLLSAYHKEQAQTRFAEAFGVIADELAVSERRLERDVSVIASDPEVVASVNMISGYASRDAYQAIVFDPEKKILARELESVLRVSPVDQLAVYDQAGELLAFGLRLEEGARFGIISYDNGHPVAIVSSDLHQWRPGNLPQQVSRTIDPASGVPAIQYRGGQSGLIIDLLRPVERSYPNGAQKRIGFVTGAVLIDQRFVDRIGRETQVALAISVPGRGSVNGIEGLQSLPVRDRVPLLEHAARQGRLSDSEDFFLSSSYRPLVSGNKAYFILGQPKDAVNAQIRRTRTVVLTVLAVSALLMIPIGTLLARRTISAPLERLVSAVEALRRGNYGTVVRVESRDEIGHLAASFNSMSETIRQREAQLKESEANYRRLIETSEEGVWVIDAKGRTLFANRRMAEMLGTTVEAMAETTMFDFMDEEVRREAEYNLSRRARGIREQHDFRFRRRDGRELWAIVSASPIHDDDGQFVGALAMVTDITERQRNEQSNALLHRFNLRVLEGMEPAEVLQEVCRELTQVFGFPLVWIGLKGEDGSVRIAARSGEAADYLDGFEARWDAGSKSMGPSGRAIRLGKSCVSRPGDGEFDAWNESAGGTDIAASAALPLVVAKGEVLGTLNLYSRHADVFNPAAMQRLEDLANRLTVAYMLALDQARLRLQGTAMEAAANAIMITGPDGRIEWVNRAFVRLSGYTRREVVGRTPDLLKSGRHPPGFYEKLWRTVLSGEVWQQELVNRRKDGTLYTVEQTITPLLDEEGRISHFIAIQEDVTAKKEAEAHIRYMEQYDPLTGLPNRMLLADRLRHALALAQRNGRHVAVIQLDLDRFKNVNDSLGPSIGDELLKEVARVLQQRVRPEDTVSRQGGDEFTLLLENLPDAEQAANVAQKIVEAFSEPFQLAGQEIFVTCSMGIALYPVDDDTPEGLIKAADTAMFGAKEQGRNLYRFFTTDLDVQATARLKLENALRRALERDEFILFYQPQVEAATGKVIAAEALIRWRHPEMGLVPPDRFIPIAEDTGLIVPIGEWVLREACAAARQWREWGLPLRVAVNLSAVQLKRSDMASLVGDVLEQVGLEPRWLELEITESEIMHSPEAARETLGRLKQMGVHIAIDDFGTGYSSFGQLRSLPVHRLKIDRSFVSDIENPDGASITATIITLAHSLKLKVIAEGVEEEEQLAFLREHGCDEIQGYYFSRPLPAEEFAVFLKEETAKAGAG